MIPLALLILGWRRHGHPVPLPLDASRAKHGKFLGFFVNLAHSLPALLLAVPIIFIAGPQQFGEPQSKRVLTNIQFCVDVSGSMTASFGDDDGDRYDAAMASIIEYIDFREGDAFGLTIFGSDHLHWVPLTSDPSALKCAPPFLNPRDLPHWFGGGTMIGMALRECIKVVAAREEGDRMIILLSDGESFDLGGGNADRVAQELVEENIVLFCVHIGGSSAPEDLYTLAEPTGGSVFAAGDPAALDAVFRHIDTMQETKLEEGSAETMDHFRPWIIGGLAAFALYLLTLFGFRYTPW